MSVRHSLQQRSALIHVQLLAGSLDYWNARTRNGGGGIPVSSVQPPSKAENAKSAGTADDGQTLPPLLLYNLLCTIALQLTF